MKKQTILLSLIIFYCTIIANVVVAQHCTNFAYYTTLESVTSISQTPPFTYQTSGTINPDKTDVFTFYVYAGQTITVNLDVQGDVDLDLFLKNPSCRNVRDSTNSMGRDESLTYTATVSGTYQVEVTEFSFGSGAPNPPFPYRIYISVSGEAPTPTPTTPTPTPNDPYEPNDAMSQARTISVPTTISNLYLTATDEDWFRFCIDSSYTVTIETYYAGGSSVDTVLYLYSSGGSQIAYDDDGGSGLYSRIQRTLSSGCYYIKVRSYGSQTGDYGLRVSLSTPTTPITATTPVTTPVATTPAPGAPPLEGWEAWLWNMVNSTIIAPITSGIQTIVNTIMQGLSTIANMIIQPIIDGLTYVGQGVVGIFRSIYDAITTAIRTVLFGGGSQASVIPKEASAQVTLTTLGYIFVGTVLCVIGVGLIVYTGEIPIVNIITTIIGFTLIILGVEVGLYGIAPEYAVKIATVLFTIIWVVGVGIIIYHEIRALRR